MLTQIEKLTSEQIIALLDVEINVRLANALCERGVAGWYRKGDLACFPISHQTTARWPHKWFKHDAPDLCHDHGLIGPVAEALGVWATPVYACDGEAFWTGHHYGRNTSGILDTAGCNESLTRVLAEACFWLLQ